MNLEKLKLRLGIDSNDTGFDNELNGWIEDAQTELRIYVGASELTPDEWLLPSYDIFVRNYVLLMFKGDDMTQIGHSFAVRQMEDGKENFFVERFNKLNGSNN